MKQDAFPLRQLPAAKFQELISDSYTVIRSDRQIQDGFCIPAVGHYCKDKQETGWQHAHAWDGINSAQLTEAQAADLVGGGWYVNLHTSAYPNGEIRGQVLAAR